MKTRAVNTRNVKSPYTEEGVILAYRAALIFLSRPHTPEALAKVKASFWRMTGTELKA